MDPYTILGIRKGASADEIKKAYRRLARMHHPDKGGNEEMFKKIQGAYDSLESSEPSKSAEPTAEQSTSTEIVPKAEGELGQVRNMIHKAKLKTVNIGINPDSKLRRMGNFMVMKPLKPNMMDEYQDRMIRQREGGIKRVPVAQSGGVSGMMYRRSHYE
jgi:hypothetical protein